MFTYLSEEYSIIGIKPKLRFRRLKNQLIELASSSIAEISRLALKIVVMAREQGTGNRKRVLGDFTFLYIPLNLYVHLLTVILLTR
jgi:hypothetical protein